MKRSSSRKSSKKLEEDGAGDDSAVDVDNTESANESLSFSLTVGSEPQAQLDETNRNQPRFSLCSKEKKRKVAFHDPSRIFSRVQPHIDSILVRRDQENDSISISSSVA